MYMDRWMDRHVLYVSLCIPPKPGIFPPSHPKRLAPNSVPTKDLSLIIVINNNNAHHTRNSCQIKWFYPSKIRQTSKMHAANQTQSSRCTQYLQQYSYPLSRGVHDV